MTARLAQFAPLPALIRAALLDEWLSCGLVIRDSQEHLALRAALLVGLR